MLPQHDLITAPWPRRRTGAAVPVVVPGADPGPGRGP
ncbi:hypothetical protein Mnod_2399 [Methylobacterium nodulans ORS 2060]|uniref:Uncharacterized protein n=1 Tax=Methylobacterium nodulans (strain LMG 21967 / CNCM I-2342 / ORS 2060) TaxID=460265 RepID=B8IBF6_METNO|nr:hypothetical protein Mnod_2399 [Methylobacterium nodulans ORS 2060]